MTKKVAFFEDKLTLFRKEAAFTLEQFKQQMHSIFIGDINLGLHFKNIDNAELSDVIIELKRLLDYVFFKAPNVKVVPNDSQRMAHINKLFDLIFEKGLLFAAANALKDHQVYLNDSKEPSEHTVKDKDIHTKVTLKRKEDGEFYLEEESKLMSLSHEKKQIQADDKQPLLTVKNSYLFEVSGKNLDHLKCKWNQCTFPNSIINEKSLYNLIIGFILAIFKKVGMCPTHAESTQKENMEGKIILGSKNPVRINEPVIFDTEVAPEIEAPQFSFN